MWLVVSMHLRDAQVAAAYWYLVVQLCVMDDPGKHGVSTPALL